MKVLISPGRHDILSHLICFFTHGKGSHVAMLRHHPKLDHKLALASVFLSVGNRAGAAIALKELTYHDAFWPRLKDKPFTLDEFKRYEIYDLEGATKLDHKEFEMLFDKNLSAGITYSIFDLFRYLFNAPHRDQHHTFCSRYFLRCCIKVLKPNQVPLQRVPYGDWASPRDVRISPRLIPEYMCGKKV